MPVQMRLVIDNNVWVSFAFGKRLGDLSAILNRPGLLIFASEAQIRELEDVFSRPKFQKILPPERIAETLRLMCESSTVVPVLIEKVDFADSKDNFLLDLCAAVEADFLVTGDKLLLDLAVFPPTEIISYASFLEKMGR